MTISTTEHINSDCVVDVKGKIVKSFVNVDSLIDVSELKKGVYLLQMQTKNGIVNRKFIKE